MKHFILAILALGAAALAAAQDVTTLTLWTRLSEEQSKGVFDAFEETHPSIDLEIEYIPGGKNHINKLIAAIAAGNAPDIVTLDVVATEAFVNLDALLPLDQIMAENPEVAAGVFPAGPLETGAVGGIQYAIPFGGSASAVAYNKELFREVGLDPENPPETWEAFVEVAKKLTFDRDGDGTIDVYGLQFVPSQASLTTFRWLPYFWMAGGEFVDRDAMKFTFNSEAGVRALEYLMDMHLKHGVVPPSAIGAAGNTDTQLELLQGRVAMTLDGSTVIQRVNRDAPDFALGIMPHPAPSAGEPHLSFAGGDNLAIMAGIPEDKMDAAVQALIGLTSVEVQRLWFENPVFDPVRGELIDDPFYETHPQRKAFLEAFLNAHEPPRTSHYVEVQQYLRDAFEQVAFGLATPQEALDEAVRRGNALIERTGRP